MGSNILRKEPEQMTPRAYALLKKSENTDFIEIYKELHALKNLSLCHAVKGDKDLILVFQTESVADSYQFYDKYLKRNNNIQTSELLFIQNPQSENQIAKSPDFYLPQVVYSYLFIKVETEKQKLFINAVTELNEIVNCDYLDGIFNLVLIISGKSFVEIDKLIEKRIMRIDGIIKAKKYPIINIFNL